jgi:hypothetical protein
VALRLHQSNAELRDHEPLTEEQAVAEGKILQAMMQKAGWLTEARNKGPYYEVLVLDSEIPGRG